jgi:two-component system, NtrC family, response regulator HydG
LFGTIRRMCSTVTYGTTGINPSPSRLNLMRARLAVLDGDALPTEVELAPERPISIGRSRDNTVVLPREDQASRLHARVYFENGRWLLRDFGLNGTRIDKARVNQVAELADGNEIRIGGVRLKFELAAPIAPSGIRGSTVSDRPGGSETPPSRAPGPRWTTDELAALNQFMAAAVEARELPELGRAAVQSLFYQTGSALVGLFTLDPSDPVAKVIWPEAARIDEHLARQLTRRLHRDHRLVWLAEDTAATLPTQSSSGCGLYADALALPLAIGRKVYGAIHLYKAGGYFSDRDRKFAEAVAGFAAPAWRSLKGKRVLEAEVARLKSALPDGDELVGDSPAMVALRAELTRAAAGPRPIVFRGEPGVGKELAAREAHNRGPRADGPFVAVRGAGTPTGLLEPELFGYRKGAFSGADKDHAGLVALADDGTLFFDEIADLPADCQAKLLKLIERKTYRSVGATTDSRADVKVMVATRKDLAAEVRAGRFRADLLAALRGAEVSVPPLRAHPEDVPHLAQFFLDRLGAECRREWALTPEAVRLLRDRPWPGNVRQLKGVLGHATAAASGEAITDADLRALLGPA